MSCTSCKSCKLRDDNMYKNLDDEKKHFLVLMMGDFRDEMIIPEELMRLKSKIPGEIQLETRIGYKHTIVVAKNQEKRVLTVGWRIFTEKYDLHMGDFLIFKYNGSSHFNVIIFNNLGREKASSAVLDPFMTQVQDRRSSAHETGSAINMDGSCGRCKDWLEYHYMNLEDEKKRFLMLMIGDFQHEMIIPEEFVNRFKGKFPGEMTLETKNRCIYKIGVAKHQEKLVLTVGWGNFVQTFGLQMGDAIVFRYYGNSKFSVKIFDKLGCENALSVVEQPALAPVQERHTHENETVNHSDSHPQPVQMQSNSEAVYRAMQMKLPVEPMSNSQVLPRPVEIKPSTSRLNWPRMESPPTERRPGLQMDKSCQGDPTPINIYSSGSSEEFFASEVDVPGSSNIVEKKSRLSSLQKEHLKDGYITTHKTRLTLVQKEAVKQKVQSLHSEIPIVVAVMGKSSVESDFHLTFPNHYAKEYLRGGLQMCLRLLGEKWDVRFVDSNRRGKRLKTGWKKFVQDNDLKIGDICLFELLSNQRRTMEVYAIRVNDGNS